MRRKARATFPPLPPNQPRSPGLGRDRPRAAPRKRRSARRVDKPVAAPAAAADPAAPKSGKRKLVLMGVVALLALAAASYARLLRPGRPLLRLHRRRLCARQQHHARRPGVRPHRGDPARRQRRGPQRRRDLPDRRRRLSHRGRRGAHARSRPSRPPSTASAARLPRWKARPSSPRRNSLPRRPR